MRVMKALNSVFDVSFSNIVDLVLELNFFQHQFALSEKKKQQHHGKKCIQISVANILAYGSLQMSNQG